MDFNWLSDLPLDDLTGWITRDLVRIIAIVAALVGLHLGARWFFGNIATRAMERSAVRGKLDAAAVQRRTSTLRLTINWALTVLFAFLIIGFVLGELGFNIATLFAAVGVVGIAVGLGAQALVKDVINGLFILIEDQYGVGDIVEVAGVSGEVIDINPRRTVLRDLDGNVHSIPNGTITTSTNMTRGFSRINIDFSVGHDEDIEHVIEVINRVCQEFSEDMADSIITPPAVLRVNALGDRGADIKVLGDVVPASQWSLMGELRRRMKLAFDAEGIEIGYPHRA